MKHERYFAGESMEETFRRKCFLFACIKQKGAGRGCGDLGEKLINEAITMRGEA